MNNKGNNIDGNLYGKLCEYSKTDIYPFHMPGHKRNTKIISMVNPISIDITEIDGFDNLHYPEEIIKELEDNISKIYNTKKSYLLVNGSTVGIMAAISAISINGRGLLIDRNCHKSVYNAALINEMDVNYIHRDYDKFGIGRGINALDIKEAIDELYEDNQQILKNKIGAVIITSPTYEGNVSDIEGIAKVCHERGIMLIVDEAHGAHFKLCDEFPKSSVDLGADIVIQSVHKTLPSMTQTSILHVCNDIEKIQNKDQIQSRIKKYLTIYQSSSPSYVLMASVSECFKIINRDGKRLFNEYVERLNKLRDRLKKLSIIKIYEGKGYDYDKGKLVFTIDEDVVKTVIHDGKEEMRNYNGKMLYNELLDRFHLQMEMSSLNYIIAMTSICDTDEGFERLIDALEIIDREIVKNNEIERNSEISRNNENVRNSEISRNTKIVRNKKIHEIYEACNMPGHKVEWNKAKGCISKDFVYVYPPGSPVIVPGEKIDESTINYINECYKFSITVQGIEDDKIDVEVQNE